MYCVASMLLCNQYAACAILHKHMRAVGYGEVVFEYGLHLRNCDVALEIIQIALRVREIATYLPRVLHNE